VLTLLRNLIPRDVRVRFIIYYGYTLYYVLLVALAVLEILVCGGMVGVADLSTPGDMKHGAALGREG
jgi:hypothetical protein